MITINERRKLCVAGCILLASLFIMAACGRKSEVSEIAEESYEDTYIPSPEEISDAVNKMNEETTQNEVRNGDIFEFYIDSDVNIVKLQMPAEYVKEGSAQTGSSFKSDFYLTGEGRGHFELEVTVYSLDQVGGPRELLEKRYPDENDYLCMPVVAPFGDEGTYKSIYREELNEGSYTTRRRIHGEKTIGFGFGSGETAAVLYITVVVTEFDDLPYYDHIYKVLDSVLIDNVDDAGARSVIESLADEYEKNMEEKMKDAITITNPEICRDICESLGLEETDRFTLEELEKVYSIDWDVLRDEDVEWLPYITPGLDYSLDFFHNENITDLRILAGFEKFKEYDILRLQLGHWTESCENLTSLDGIEELFGEDGPVLEQLNIQKCPNLEDISSLKNIGKCNQIKICLEDCRYITAEMLQDVYDSNPNIDLITVSKYKNPTTLVVDFELDSHIR